MVTFLEEVDDNSSGDVPSDDSINRKEIQKTLEAAKIRD